MARLAKFDYHLRLPSYLQVVTDTMGSGEPSSYLCCERCREGPDFLEKFVYTLQF